MFSEILHGLIGRTQQEAGCCENDPAVTLQPCPLHIGIIPAGNDALRQLFKCLMDGVRRRAVTAHILLFAPTIGSTDCVCFATVGVIDPVTSALHIIIGEEGLVIIESILHLFKSSNQSNCFGS